MTLGLLFIVLIVIELIISLAIWTYYSRSYSKLNQDAKLTLKTRYTRRWTISGLIALSLILIITPFLYYIDHDPYVTSLDAAFDSAAYNMPCIAGILAGLGLVTGRSEADFSADKSAWLYTGSVGALAIALTFYIANHPQPLVLKITGSYIMVLGTVGLAVALFQRADAEAVLQTEKKDNKNQNGQTGCDANVKSTFDEKRQAETELSRPMQHYPVWAGAGSALKPLAFMSIVLQTLIVLLLLATHAISL